MRLIYNLFVLGYLCLIYKSGAVNGKVPSTLQGPPSVYYYNHEVPFERDDSEEWQREIKSYSDDYDQKYQEEETNSDDEEEEHDPVYEKYMERKRHEESQKYLDAIKYWDKQRYRENDHNDLYKDIEGFQSTSETYEDNVKYSDYRDNGRSIEQDEVHENSNERYPRMKKYYDKMKKGQPGYYLQKWNQQQKLQKMQEYRNYLQKWHEHQAELLKFQNYDQDSHENMYKQGRAKPRSPRKQNQQHNLQNLQVPSESYCTVCDDEIEISQDRMKFDHDPEEEVEEDLSDWDSSQIAITEKPIEGDQEKIPNPMIQHIVSKVRRRLFDLGNSYMENLNKLRSSVIWEPEPDPLVYDTYPESRKDVLMSN